MALRAARAAGTDLRGATAWVTLEPCAHHGRTPPCCEALIAAGLSKVVVAIADPFPAVDGEGLRRLQAAGLEVQLADGEIANAARELNIGFFSRMERGRPWVRLKLAASLDGRTALSSGVSQWITGSEAQTDCHAWRRRAGAVLTGIGTVLADDPRLDVRHVPSALQPLRVVADSRLRLPPTARLLTPPGRVLVATACDDVERQAVLERRGAEVLVCRRTDPTDATDAAIDLPLLMQELAAREINELHVEAGPMLSGALFDAGLVDELLLYLAPTLIGPGRGLVDIPALGALAEARRLRFTDVRAIGADLRLVARPLAQASDFLTALPPHGQGGTP